MRKAKEKQNFNLRDPLQTNKNKQKKIDRISLTWAFLLLLLLLFVVFGVVLGQFPNMPTLERRYSVSAMFILGDSSVNCGESSFFSNLVGQDSLLTHCKGYESRLLPDLLAEKMGLPEIPQFYSQNGTIEGLMSGLNFGFSPATIINPGSLGYEALNQQLRQAFETIQLLQLQLGQDKAQEMVKSSLFYLSFGKDDYIKLFLPDFSHVRQRFGSNGFAQILVNQITQVVKNLYNANVRKIICMGIGPLGCSPRFLWESYNASASNGMVGANAGGACIDEINELVVEYNTMLTTSLLDLNFELPDVHIMFCDVYRGMMEIIADPERYGFENVKRACCGAGRYGGMVGCLSDEMACEEASTYVWWDFYNPTRAVNSLLADSTWFGYPLVDICGPITIQQLASI